MPKADFSEKTAFNLKQSVRPEGAEAHSQGSTVWWTNVLQEQKQNTINLIIKAFALTGRGLYVTILPRALPWAESSLGFQPALLVTNRNILHTSFYF